MRIWRFLAVPADSPSGLVWRWLEERADSSARHSNKDFQPYFECLSDAREHGYAGPNPRPHPSGA